MADIINYIKITKKFLSNISDRTVVITNTIPQSGLTDLLNRSEQISVVNTIPQSGLTDLLNRSEQISVVNT